MGQAGLSNGASYIHDGLWGGATLRLGDGGQQWPCNGGRRPRPLWDGGAGRSDGRRRRRRWSFDLARWCRSSGQGRRPPGSAHRLDQLGAPIGLAAPTPLAAGREASPQEALGALQLALAADQVYASVETLANALHAQMQIFMPL